MVDSVSVMGIIAAALEVTDKILDRIKTPAEKEKSDYMELRANYESYKERPIHQRVNEYQWNLLKEIQMIQLKLADKL